MSHSVLQHAEDLLILKYIITHVFFPLKLPDGDDHSVNNDHALSEAVADAAHLYREYLNQAEIFQWRHTTDMLENLRTTIQSKGLDASKTISQLHSMNPGDIRAILIRAQNAGIIFRQQQNVTVFESFEVSPKVADVMASQGKLVCSYPGPAIEIPTTVFNDKEFLCELVNFLVHMNKDVLDAAPTHEKARSKVLETRDTTHPRYITELLTGILRSVGSPASVTRISKRVGDDVVWNQSELPWRRSPLWLLIRVVLQTSLERSTLARHTYKTFMLFFMCYLAKESICTKLPNDLLQAMSAKISRRLQKLGSSAPSWLSRMALVTCASLRSILKERWRQVQDAQRVSPLWAPSQLDLAHDTQLSLLHSREHIHNSLSKRSIRSSDAHFEPSHRPRGTLDDLLSSSGSFFEDAYNAEPYVALYDVEHAVEQDIDQWIDQVTNSGDACVKLEILANKYSSGALKTYENNPELLSIMLLTTIELWVALDKIAVQEIPMLANYSPEVPTALLENLLLCKKESLNRLRSAYQYLSCRHSISKSGWSVFSPTVTADSFAVRFYGKSSHLQSLKARIERAAENEVRQKGRELEKANARYDSLERMVDEMEHEFGVSRSGKEYHARQCSKCRCERQLRSMQISIHEWPLPAEKLQAEAVVFELDCPISFNMWRAATFHLLVDLCTPSVQSTPPYIQLPDYTSLHPYFKRHPRSRITLASNTKPFSVTHYSKVSIPTKQERVCVNNGLSFYGFDGSSSIPVTELLGQIDISKYCTYRLQRGPYENLQKYVGTTSHTSNEVMANQIDCHNDLSIHEFIAFGHLRSGNLIQWPNILRELRGRSLSFHRHDIHFLLAQAASQVGPLENAEWTWHQELQESSFCYALLGELERLLGDVAANWLEAVTMDTISFLLRRLLAASSLDSTISQRACELLRVMRNKVFFWVQELAAKLIKTPEDEELRGFLRDAAAICRSTFDVDLTMIPRLLHTVGDIRVLLSSAMLIHHNTPANVSSLSAYSQLLLDRDRRLSLALESVVSVVIQADSSDQGIDLAVGWIWPGYRPDSRWKPLQSQHSRWFSCKTSYTESQSSQVVHLNLLDGSLVVDGKSLGRLPSEIQLHSLYDVIFRGQVLEVIPADLQGMDYVVRGRICDHQLVQVYLSLRDKDLVIRAIATGSSQIIELVPPEKLEGDLPAVLIKGHAHWLNLTTSVIEIRPLSTLWKSSPENWRIDCTKGKYRMHKGHEILIDSRSKSWNMVSSLLKPLDASQNLIISVLPADPKQPSSPLQLSVIMPRYGLSFFVDEDGDLQSRNLRGMVYDENQSIRTLFGLVNLLVLRPKLRDDAKASEVVPRCILIPEGDVSFQTDGHHVRVEIDTCGPALQRVIYHTYRINTDLGCLAGNASLTNRLYCAYLHALTSGCGIDPLTGRSGTEEALSLLQSARCWSVMRFSSRDAELLRMIASLCPPRTWYPQHLRRMQTVEWLDLPVNSQHHELYFVSKTIKEHYDRVQLFYEAQPHKLFEDDFPEQDKQLLERSAQRLACLFPSSSSGQASRGRFDHDVRYSARDIVEANSGEHRAYAAATVVHHRKASSITNKDILLNLLKSWEGKASGSAVLSLQYDKSWLAPELPLIWLEAYKLLRGNNEGKWLQLLFSLPAMAYASPERSDLVPAFVAFAMDSNFRAESPPQDSSYDLSKGFRPSPATLCGYISDSAQPFERSPESSESPKSGEKHKDLQKRRLQMYKKRRAFDNDWIVQELLDSWPCETAPECLLDPDLYDLAELSSRVQSLFTVCYRNLKLKGHLTRVQKILNTIYSHVLPTPILRYSFQPSRGASSSSSCPLTVDQLFTRAPPTLPARSILPTDVESTSLYQLISAAESDTVNPFEQEYISTLRTSAERFGGESSLGAQGTTNLPAVEKLEAHYVRCREDYIDSLDSLKEQLGPRSESERALEQSNLWPRITTHTLFRCLASNSSVVLPDNWKKCLVKLTLLALELQRARRLLQLHLDNLREELLRELENEGCDGWSPDAHPDWLLIQLQGNFLVRHVQAEVAKEMIAPRSGSNTAMQLNMGEGKSSVIIPIVAVDLADGDQLVRVIVPKALTGQMFYLLADRLGGLVNRRIYFIPFSRSLEIDHQKITALRELMSECMRVGGILVTQPEHLLSLRLVSVEKQLPQEGDTQLAHLLLELQKWLHAYSRDILDECDEILHVRYQLVYTIGLQQHVEGSPERWTTTQQILGLVNKHAPSLRKRFPLGVEHEHGPSGSFPHLRILHVDAGRQLVSWIAQDIINNLLPDFNLGQLRKGLRDAIQIFISCEDTPLTSIQLVQEYAQKTPLWNGLLLLRGILATGILLYALKERRWRVDYGLVPVRTMLAVPYRAKDVPAPRAEFGHPDIAIVLTCLSYYYGGLTKEQLRLSFEILLRQDDPTLDYNLWVRDCSDVPADLRKLNGVNLKSSEQWDTFLFPLFKRNQATVDFYLSNVVFPKEAKEFPSKLSCSGWDLAEKKDRLVTGFSGTNDGRYLLPLHITQRDADHQRGTNAKVLSYLLQPENNYYMCMNHKNGERRTTNEFLQILVAQKPEIRVLLDVGAQMLDMKNHKLAEKWLDMNLDASAAIYFNEDDELTVRTRDGATQLFLSSPFAQQLDQCVVYLDDAHTRGTDIKFPSGFRAAVTLGPKVTKDRLTQGCMRMRYLCHGHSIMFFAPLEVDRRIRVVAGKDKDAPTSLIKVTDILHWAMRETWEEIKKRAPHWAQQGMDHSSRYGAWTSFCRGQLSPKVLSSKWLRPEAKRLEDLYAPHNAQNPSLSVTPEIRQRCVELGASSLRDMSMDEEQEREVAHEVERERYVERPPKVPPESHSVHPDVASFVQTGIIPTSTTVFLPVFEMLDETSAATDETDVWSRFVLATTDFWSTVSSPGKRDEYLRPVQWVVSTKGDGKKTLVIMSPYEVNHLMPLIRSSNRVHLHPYTPRVTRSTKPCDDLALYSIPAVSTGWASPPALMDQLNLFAGQLYLRDYKTYIRLCRFLCVYTKDLQGQGGIEVGSDGFISPTTRRATQSTFHSSPISFLRALMSLRRKGMRFTQTHMGKLLDGRPLSEEDFNACNDYISA